METRSVAELIAEIPDGWEYTTSPKGDVVVCHPEHPPRIMRVGSEAWEDLEFSEPGPGVVVFGALKQDGTFDVNLLRLKGFKIDEMHAKSRERFLAHAGPDPKPSLLKRFLAWWDPK